MTPSKAQQAPAKAPVAEAVKAALTPPAPEEAKNDLVILKPTPELNPRNKAMAEIAARANADADKDAGESVAAVDDEGNEVAPAAAAPAPPEEPAPGAHGEAPAGDAAPQATPAPE